MKLVELSANKPSFRTINFKPNGLNIIVGKHIDDESKSTYNGVGKSFALYLIQFCLGSKSNSKLTSKLEDWVFYLKFQIGDNYYKTERSISKQSKIVLNDEELNLSEFHEIMMSLLFKVSDDVQKASFRSLISRFLRTRKEEYLKFDKYVYKEQEERALLSNAILLGLKYDLVEKKFLLKEEYNHINNLRNGINSDEIFKSIFGDEKDSEIKIKELEENVESLEKSVKSFEIAEDYREAEDESNKLSYKVKSLTNNVALLKETKSNIEKSLQVKTDIGNKEVLKLLEHVRVELGVDVEKKVSEVMNFHDRLVNGREQRLTSEKIRLNREIIDLELELAKTTKLYNESLKYLNKYGALEDYVSINQKLVDYKSSLEKLKSSLELLDKYKKREQEIKVTLAQDNLKTEEYLVSERENHLKLLMDNYRQLTGRFYDDKKGGISVLNNEGENKLRYNIDVRIQDDSSDGINEVRIFCFDILILILQKNHNVKFVFHDSRLYSNMDTHQRFTALNISDSLKNDGFQYIMSVNQDTIDILKEERTEEEFKKVIQENIILELSGDKPENRLLGIHTDLNYE